MNTENKPKVTILLLVYNHEKFLRDCLDSILVQKINFGLEVIIGDDCSTDKSRAIIQEYASKYPNIFIPILHQNRFGGSGTMNLVTIMSYMKGKYFLMFEGDDIYTSPNKLQKQVDFLDNNPDYTLCFHNATVFYDDNSLPSYLLNEHIEQDTFTVSDLIGEQEVWFMATASIMYRSNKLGKIPDWFMKSKSCDIPLHFLIAKHGKIKYLPEVMSAYRKHAAGASFSDKYDDAVFIQNRIEMYQGIDGYLDYQFHKRFKKLYAWYYRFMIDSKQAQQNYFKRITWLFNYFYLAGFPSGNRKWLIATYAIPKPLLNIYTKIRSKK